MQINIMKKGDEFVGIYGNLVAIKKMSGEVELTELILDENGCIRLDKTPKIRIGYGDNVVEVDSSEGDVKTATF